MTPIRAATQPAASTSDGTHVSRYLVHVVGRADLGLGREESLAATCATLEGADAEMATALLTRSAERGRDAPLIGAFGAGPPSYDGVLLVATRPQIPALSLDSPRPADDDQFTETLAGHIRTWLCRPESIYGRVFDLPTVEVLVMDAPRLAASRTVISAWLQGCEWRARLDLYYGGGATATALGVVVGALEAGVEPLLILPSRDGRIDRDIRLSSWLPRDHVDRWLVRNRFYAAVPAARGEEPADPWTDLTNRQILAETLDPSQPEYLAGVTQELLDRHGSGTDVIDAGLFRRWREAQTRAYLAADKPGATSRGAWSDLSATAELFLGMSGRGTTDGSSAGKGKEILYGLRDQHRAMRVPTRTVDFLIDSYDARGATDDLLHEGKRTQRSAKTIRECVERHFARHPDQIPEQDARLRTLGYPRWKYFGERRRLILLAVGNRNPPRPDEPQNPVIDELVSRSRADGREPVIRLIVTPMEGGIGSEDIGQKWTENARRDGIDCQTSRFDLARPIEEIRLDLFDALDGEGNLDTVADIWVVANAGVKQHGLAVLTAGIEWGLWTVCPTYLATMYSAPGSTGKVSFDVDRKAVLNKLAADTVIAHVARAALDGLDLAAAAALLDTGSAGLRRLAQDVRALDRLAFGIPTPNDLISIRDATAGATPSLSPGWDRLVLLRARLTLIERLAGTNRWGCVIRAAMVCETAFKKRREPRWSPPLTWTEFRGKTHSRAAADLGRLRNQWAHPQRATPAPSEQALHDLLRKIRDDLSRLVHVNDEPLPNTWDMLLVNEFDRIRTAIQEFADS